MAEGPGSRTGCERVVNGTGDENKASAPFHAANDDRALNGQHPVGSFSPLKGYYIERALFKNRSVRVWLGQQYRDDCRAG